MGRKSKLSRLSLKMAIFSASKVILKEGIFQTCIALNLKLYDIYCISIMLKLMMLYMIDRSISISERSLHDRLLLMIYFDNMMLLHMLLKNPQC